MTVAATTDDFRPGTLRYKSTAGHWVVAATVLGSGIATLDGTVVGIALPAIGRDLDAGVASLQWVVNAYTLTLAGLLLLGGSLGDRFGRRRIFTIGTIWFALASLLCGVAPTTEVLVLARALQGVGAALLTPGSLAILQASFTTTDRSRAIGAWSGLGGIAAAVGPFLGGWLISAVSWRLIFFINLPLAVVVVLISSRHVPESVDPKAGHIDITGAVAITAALVGLTYGLIEGPANGWTPVVIGSLIASVVLFVVFVYVESRKHSPLVPLSIFLSRQFSGANAATFLVYGALGGVFFLLPIVLQVDLGYSPLLAGSALLPVTAIMFALSARSAALAARIGPRLQMTVGPLVIAAGVALLTRVGPGSTYLDSVLPAMVVFGFGLAINVAPLTATVLAAAPAEHAGVASAVNNDVARTGGLIAVAILPAAAGITGNAFANPGVLAHGFHKAVMIAAVGCVIAGVLGFTTIRNPIVDQPTEKHPHDYERSCGLDGPPLRGSHHYNSERISLAARSPDRTAPSI